MKPSGRGSDVKDNNGNGRLCSMRGIMEIKKDEEDGSLVFTALRNWSISMRIAILCVAFVRR